MKDILKPMLIPIIGVIAIGLLFLLTIYGGNWEEDVYNEEGTFGLATKDLGAVDATMGITGECDGNLYSPVCGLDGESYDNACFAVQAGTTVAHQGQCGPR